MMALLRVEDYEYIYSHDQQVEHKEETTNRVSHAEEIDLNKFISLIGKRQWFTVQTDNRKIGRQYRFYQSSLDERSCCFVKTKNGDLVFLKKKNILISGNN